MKKKTTAKTTKISSNKNLSKETIEKLKGLGITEAVSAKRFF